MLLFRLFVRFFEISFPLGFPFKVYGTVDPSRYKTSFFRDSRDSVVSILCRVGEAIFLDREGFDFTIIEVVNFLCHTISVTIECGQFLSSKDCGLP